MNLGLGGSGKMLMNSSACPSGISKINLCGWHPTNHGRLACFAAIESERFNPVLI